jgi:hypothetical protein
MESFFHDRRFTLPSSPATRGFEAPEVRALWESSDCYSEQSVQDTLTTKLEQFGNPCQIEWLSVDNMPFEEVRGLKNAWNSHKDIHVARNVTAVDSRAGSTLLNYWRTKAEVERYYSDRRR